MTAAVAKVREVIVIPLAARREALFLFGMIGLIILLMGIRFSCVRTTTSKTSIKPYQQKDASLKNQAPILYRSLLSVVEDIIDIRDETGKWPEVKSLKAEILPPFAVDFLPAGVRGFAWEIRRGEGWVDYYGVNKDVGKPEKEAIDPLENSFMLRFIDLKSKEHPHPHLASDNDPSRRFSHQIWMYPEPRKYPGEDVKAKGWKWIIGSSDPLSSKLEISEKPGQ